MNCTFLNWHSCAVHVSPAQSFDRIAWVSLYGWWEMGSQSVTPSCRIMPPTQTSPSLRPVLLTSVARNIHHQKSRTMIQIFLLISWGSCCQLLGTLSSFSLIHAAHLCQNEGFHRVFCIKIEINSAFAWSRTRQTKPDLQLIYICHSSVKIMKLY